MAKGNIKKPANGSALEFEAQLWAAADKMRGHMDASEYKYVVLGLVSSERRAAEKTMEAS